MSESENHPHGELSEDLLQILVCPVCRVSVSREDDWLVCVECGRRYPVRDGVPIMLPEEASPASGVETP